MILQWPVDDYGETPGRSIVFAPPGSKAIDNRVTSDNPTRYSSPAFAGHASGSDSCDTVADAMVLVDLSLSFYLSLTVSSCATDLTPYAVSLGGC